LTLPQSWIGRNPIVSVGTAWWNGKSKAYFMVIYVIIELGGGNGDESALFC